MRILEISIRYDDETNMRTMGECFREKPIDEFCQFLINKKIVDDISYTKRFTVEKAVMERLSQ